MKPGYLSGTRWITFCSNHEYGLRVARLLTAVGLLRASIGPPIITMVFGASFPDQGSPSCAISATAQSTGTVGWQTEITFRSGRCGSVRSVMNSRT